METYEQTAADMLQRFLRYEIPYDRIHIDPAQAGLRISFEDVLAAIERIDREQIPMIRVLDEWMDPLYRIGDDIGLPEALGFENTKTAEILLDDIIGRSPLNRENTLYHVLGNLWHAPQMFKSDADFLAEAAQWKQMMENTLWNEERPIYEWKLTIMQKLHYVLDLFQSESIDLCDRAHQDLFRRSLEELCDEGIYDALRIKAFCSVDGNSVYPKDIDLAAEFFEICAEEDEDAMSANALGDIYLRGDLNDGIPQYDLAYKYYSLAAFAGVYESMCRCADLLMEGHGIPRNRNAAYNQILYVYTHTKQAFTEGIYSIAFADAAVRMGECWENGTAGPPDLKLAYSYYLDAETAVRMRMRYDKCRDDNELYEKIRDSLQRLSARLGDDCMEKESVLPEPLLIDRMLSGGYPLRMRCEKAGDRQMVLRFTRTEQIPYYGILLTVESMSASDLYSEVCILADGCDDLEEGTDVVFSAVGFDFSTKRTILYHQGEEVLSFRTEHFRYRCERPDDWYEQPPVSYACVQFSDGSRGEYRCDVPGLKRGDRVIVPTAIGEQEAAVVCMFRERTWRMEGLTENMRVLRKVSLHLMA